MSDDVVERLRDLHRHTAGDAADEIEHLRSAVAHLSLELSSWKQDCPSCAGLDPSNCQTCASVDSWQVEWDWTRRHLTAAEARIEELESQLLVHQNALGLMAGKLHFLRPDTGSPQQWCETALRTAADVLAAERDAP